MRRNKIIFDFDHTLVKFGPHVDWRRAILKIEEIYLAQGIPPAIVEESKGLGFRLMRTVYDQMQGVLSPERLYEVQGLVFSALEGYELAGIDRGSPMEGAEEILAWLKSRACQCAVVSSNATRAVEGSLERLGWNSFFAGVFGRDVSCRLKPYPDQNQLCLQSLGWRAEETLLVGDSPDDILSAKPLSIYAVGVASGLAKRERLVDAGADRTIDRLGELPSVLEAL